MNGEGFLRGRFWPRISIQSAQEDKEDLSQSSRLLVRD